MADIKLFEYQHKQMRTVTIEGQVWVVAKDVCDILEIANSRDAVSSLSDKMRRTVASTDAIGRAREMTVINESGIYKLAFRSNKPEAERFTEWVAVEVIPQIRATGRYVPKHQGVLPLSAHTDTEVQKDMSKAVNAHNFQLGGEEATVYYNVQNCLAHTGKTPSQLKDEGRRAGLKSKDRNSGKAVARVLQPEAAPCMSLADNLVEQGYEPEKVFNVTRKAKPVFKGMLELGVTPAELEK
jgi:prophage antirepressor-like protein